MREGLGSDLDFLVFGCGDDDIELQERHHVTKNEKIEI